MGEAFAYLRVSGQGQVDGFGFDRQLETVQAYAASHNVGIVKVFKEEVSSNHSLTSLELSYRDKSFFGRVLL